MNDDRPGRRGTLGWSQAVLADRPGVSRQRVIAVERGRVDPSLPPTLRIAGVFDCRTEDVFTPAEVRVSS